MQSHEIEQNKRDQDELNAQIAFDSYKPTAIRMISDCFASGGDIQDVLNDLVMDAESCGVDLTAGDVTVLTYIAAGEFTLNTFMDDEDDN